MIAFSQEPVESRGKVQELRFFRYLPLTSPLRNGSMRFWNRIRRLSNLPSNWDSYGASPPNQQSLRAAESFIKGLSLYVGVLKPEVSLTANGNAAFLWEWQEGNRNLDLEVLANGTINYAYVEEEDESRDQEGRTQDGLKIVDILTQW